MYLGHYLVNLLLFHLTTILVSYCHECHGGTAVNVLIKFILTQLLKPMFKTISPVVLLACTQTLSGQLVIVLCSNKAVRTDTRVNVTNQRTPRCIETITRKPIMSAPRARGVQNRFRAFSSTEHIILH